MENPSESPTGDPIESRRLVVRAAAVGLCALVALLATSPGLPMVWDEGNAILRAGRIAEWSGSWFQQGPPGWRNPLGREAISEGWPYTTRVEGHPAFYGIAISAGHWLGRHFLPPLTAWRLGPMLLFAAAAAAMFYRLSRDYGQTAGLAAVLALVLQPRLFAHAHFATCDGSLTACWILAWAAFAPARDGWRKAVLFGVLLGMTMSAKATGWIAPIPFILWAVLFRDRRAGLALAVGLPAALGTFYLLNPPLWHEPAGGLTTFFQLNTNRQLNVANFFLGRMYDLHHPLPWYNTLVWTAVAVPVGLLLLAGVGLGSILRRGLSDRPGILLVVNWIVLLVVRAIPGTPPHDGIRLFLPAFAFLAGIVGVGTSCILAGRAGTSLASLVCHWRPAGANPKKAPKSRNRARASGPSRTAWIAPAGVGLILLGSASSLWWYAPQWLSYYNLLIGGLPGATRAGMEPTYYWDSLDAEVLHWLASNTGENEKVRFGSASPENLALMRRWGILPVEYRAEAAGRYRWYVIQRRPSATMPPDQWLLEHAEPVYKKYIHRHGYGPWRLNVPLLEVYRYEDYKAAVEATKE